MGQNGSGILFGLLAFALFSAHDVAIKFLGGSHAAPQIIFFATLMSFPLVTFLLMSDPTEANLRPVHPWWSALRTACAVAAMLCAFHAFSTLPLGQVYALLFAMPLVVTVLSVPLLGERVGWRRAMAVLVGLGGVLVVLRPGLITLQTGHLAALLAAVLSGTASVIVRRIGREERPVVLLLYPLAANYLLMGAALPFVYRPMPLAHLATAGLIALLGFLAALCVIAAYRRAEAVLVAPMQYSQILWAILYGSLLFDELPDMPTLAGSAIIIASGLYIVAREARKGATSTRPVLRTRTRGVGMGFRVSPFLHRRRQALRPTPPQSDTQA